MASLLQKQAQIFHDAGQRSEFKVYFNGATTPAGQNIVVLEWTDEALMSLCAAGINCLRQRWKWAGKSVRLVEGNHIEFMELMTPDKMLDV